VQPGYRSGDGKERLDGVAFSNYGAGFETSIFKGSSLLEFQFTYHTKRLIKKILLPGRDFR
jgi:hypothetical protein